MLGSGQLRPWPDPQRHGWPVRRNDDLIARSRTAAFALLATAGPFCGCGGSSQPASTQAGHGHAGGLDRRQVLVAALGDSITAGSPSWDPNPQVRSQLGGAANAKSQFEYWAAKADPQVRFRNCGIFGQTTVQIVGRARFCGRGADVLIVQGGINDIAQTLDGGPQVERRVVHAAAAYLQAAVERGKRHHKRVMLANVLPWNNGYPRAAAPIRALNRRITAVGRREAVPVLDFYSALEDPDNPGRMRPDWTSDGDHPSIAGYAILGGRVVAPALRRILGQSG